MKLLKKLKNMTKGLFIVIDGTDGSGKKTQTDLLYNWLLEIGQPVEKISFPSHNEPSGYFTDQYLDGVYGEKPDDVNPKVASIFYALDRFHKSETIIKKKLAENKIVIADRYVTANMGHQGSKFKNEDELKKYFTWLYELEYDILKIPKPDLNIILHVSPEINSKLITTRGNLQDIHEKDPGHLKRAELAYLTMVKLFPDDMTLIECVENEQIMSREKIHELIKEKVKTILNKKITG